jgi:hypothetical protein
MSWPKALVTPSPPLRRHSGDTLPGARRELLPEHHRQIADRPRRIGLEQLADRRERKVPRRSFLEHAEAREHAHNAIERGRVCFGLCGDLLNRACHRIHVIGDPKPRHCRDRIKELLAEEQLHHYERRRGSLRCRLYHQSCPLTKRMPTLAAEFDASMTATLRIWPHSGAGFARARGNSGHGAGLMTSQSECSEWSGEDRAKGPDPTLSPP